MKTITLNIEDDYFDEIEEIMKENSTDWQEMLNKSLFIFVMVYGYKKSYEFASNSYDMQSTI